MPYFFILPVYFVAFAGLLVISAMVRLWPTFRGISSYLFYGALGTLPGLLAGNFFFWSALLLFTVLFRQVPIAQAGEIVRNTVAVGFLAAAGIGLVIANCAGCASGFVAGLWWRARRDRRRELPAAAAE
jgi:hypothetical protein